MPLSLWCFFFFYLGYTFLAISGRFLFSNPHTHSAYTWHRCVSFFFKRFLFTFSLFFFFSASSYSSSVSSVFGSSYLKCATGTQSERGRDRRSREGVSKSAIVCLLPCAVSSFSIGNFSRCDFDLRLAYPNPNPREFQLSKFECVFCLFLLLAHWICHLWV